MVVEAATAPSRLPSLGASDKATQRRKVVENQWQQWLPKNSGKIVQFHFFVSLQSE